MRSFQRILSLLLALTLVLSCVPVTHATRVTWEQTDREVTAQWASNPVQKQPEQERDPKELVRVSIVLEQSSTVAAGYSTMGIASDSKAMAYRAELLAIQKRMARTISLQALDGRPLDVAWNMTLVGNIISAWVPYGSIEKISAIAGIKTVALEAQYQAAEAERSEGVSPNVYPGSGMIGSGVLWDGGYTGAGSRIAVIDTGTDLQHQSFDNDAYLYALQQNAAAKGMRYEDYVKSLDLLDAQEVAELLPQLHVSERNATLLSAALYNGEKNPFGFNYVDNNLNLGHLRDEQSEHGSHVAGIATANRYIPQADGTYADAKKTALVMGVAPDAQLLTMKVFGEHSPYDSDYMVAIEDAIILGCDVVNLSLGTAAPGSPHNDVYSDLMELMQHSDTVVTISAGNASNWAAATTFGYLYNDDASFDMVGSPGSYGNAFTVGSVDNIATLSMGFEVADQQFYYDEELGYGNPVFTALDTDAEQNGTEYSYVFLDSFGEAPDYTGMDVSGKIVFVQRGQLDFAVKVNNAAARGAVAVVVYNNQPGRFGMILTGLEYAVPAISITQEDAAAIRSLSRTQGTYLTGKLTVYGGTRIQITDTEYYRISDFSSWGVPENLTLKPEVVAPGGDVYSVYGATSSGGGSDQYEYMSGTSMAAPQVAGMVALLAQYCRENGMADKAGISPRHLAQSLLMSTATPLREQDSGGEYYSLLAQGAGLARVDLASQAAGYILVEGQNDGKVKAELGDDPQRTGVYSFHFTVNNMTDVDQSYTLSADLFRQDVFEYMPDTDVWMLDIWTTGLDGTVTFSADGMEDGNTPGYDMNGDGAVNPADADYLLEYALGNKAKLHAKGDISGDGKIDSYDAHLLLASLGSSTGSSSVPGISSVLVPAHGSARVTVTVELSESAKNTLDAWTPNGTYIEAFIYAESNDGTVHSIPMLAFYGDWSDPSMFDRSAPHTPYLSQSVGDYGNALYIHYGDGVEYYFGGNPVAEDQEYLPERNAFSAVSGSVLTEQSFTLIRRAGDARIQIRNARTGEVYFERGLGELEPAYYDHDSGAWNNTTQYARLGWGGTDAAGGLLPEGTEVEVALTAVSSYYRRPDGSCSFEDLGNGATLVTSMTVDNTAPQLLSVDESRLSSGCLTVSARDNRHVAAVALLNAAGTKLYTAVSPNQTEENIPVDVTLHLSGIYGSSFMLAVYDYAANVSYYDVQIDLGEVPRDYFTAYDNGSNAFVSLSKDGLSVTPLADSGLSEAVSAMEYVGGHVFVITEDHCLYAADDRDLSNLLRICRLDPEGVWLISGFNDMAYNPADGMLYAQFYSSLNYEGRPYLGTVDMMTGALEVICELPTDVNTMAIDSSGNFYCAAYGSNELYTFTLAQVTGEQPSMNYVGQMGNYSSTVLSSMAWDHSDHALYWAFPGTLLQINHRTAEPTPLGSQDAELVGLYVTPTADEDAFAPVSSVSSVELNAVSTRVLLGSSLRLEAAVWPWNASDRSVIWSSSDPGIASVDASGWVTGLREGTCRITATSRLDPTRSAECELRVFRVEKTLNGLVWDEEGDIWMAEFSTAALPEYTKLTATGMGHDLASAAVDENGRLFAASLDMGNLHSELYQLDGETFKPVCIGASTDAYVDLAPAPGQSGSTLMGILGGYVLNVDATSGDYYNYYSLFDYDLVGIAYIGTEHYTDWGYDTQVDWYFLINTVGTVYLMGFLEQDGQYYYLEHDYLAPGGIYTQIDFRMDTGYFGSAYFDGELLYFSAFKESWNNVTLMAIDVAGGTKACYTLGTFADGVWPVGGLMELGKFENHIRILSSGGAPVPMSAPKEAAEQPKIREAAATGGLHSAAAPMSVVEGKNDRICVDVTLPYDGTNADLTVTYDPSMLELTGVSGSAAAFAWRDNGGTLRISLAQAGSISASAAVARLTFRAIGQGQTGISVVTDVLGAQTCGQWEELTVSLTQSVAAVTEVERLIDAIGTVDLGSKAAIDAARAAYDALPDAHKALVGNYQTLLNAEAAYRRAVEEAAAAEALAQARAEALQELNAACSRLSAGLADSDRSTLEEIRAEAAEAVNAAATAAQARAAAQAGIAALEEARAAIDARLEAAAALAEAKQTAKAELDALYRSLNRDLTAEQKAELDAALAQAKAAVDRADSPEAVADAAAAGAQAMNKAVEDQPEDPKPEDPKPIANPFKDVKKSDYFYDSVLWAVQNRVTAGVTPTQFGPDQPCTRAQVVTFLWRAKGEPKAANRTNPFKDVKKGEYYYEAVLWAVENGITAGLTETTFGPDAACTRAQVVSFLYRTMDKPEITKTEHPFRDIRKGEYYYDAVLWAVENEVTAGTSPTTFAPNATCTRGQIVSFLYRALAE